MSRADYLQLYRRLQHTKTQYAECVRILRTDGTAYRFTAHDKEIEVKEEDGRKYTYTPADAFELTAVETQIGLVVSNMDIKGIISDDSIVDNELRAGFFDHANVTLFLAYWASLTIEMLPIRTSWIGELQTQGSEYKVDLRGIAQKLAQVFVETTSVECRWDFCDWRCGVDPASFTQTGQIVSTYGGGNSLFQVSMSGAVDFDYYEGGVLTFTSGANDGLSMEVLEVDGDELLKLFLPMPYAAQPGDTFSLLQGCPKTFSACKDRFDNHERYGGEPFMAGSDTMRQYAKMIEQG